MDWQTLYAAVETHAAELGPLAEHLTLVIQTNEAGSLKEREEQLAAAAQAAAALDQRRLEETEDALALLNPAWTVAFPQIRDLVRTALAGWTDFGSARDLTVDFQPAGPLSEIRLVICREWKNGRPAFTKAYLGNAGYRRGFRADPAQAPEYEEFFSVSDIDDLLFCALRARVLHDEWSAAHTAWLVDEELRLAAVEADHQRHYAEDQARKLDQQAAEAEQGIETERLLAWVKSDPAVANLVRAFIAIEEERSSWQDRLNNADEAASNAWSHCERKSAELRRQADEARAEADRQRQAARDYEYEADEARKKMKDAERRADSYYRSSSW